MVVISARLRQPFFGVSHAHVGLFKTRSWSGQRKQHQLAKATNHKLSQAGFEQLIVDSNSLRMFDWRQRILHNELNIDIDVYLLQRQSHGTRFGVCEHDELDVRRGLVVVQLVLGGAVRQEAARGQSL